MTPNAEFRMRQEILRIIEKAVELYDVPELRNTDIRFDIRSYRFVGQAGYRTNRRTGTKQYTLRINPKAVVEDFDDMLNDTIPHEIAHLVNYARPLSGRKHNRGWKRVCLALGGNGQTTCGNNYNLGKPTKEEWVANYWSRRPYVYIDSVGTERRVTKAKHNKIQNGVAYIWRDTGGRVDWDSAYQYNKLPSAKEASTKAKPAKACNPQNRRCKGQPSKASIALGLIKLHFPTGPDQLHTDQIIIKIMDHCNFKKGLAKSYFNHYLPKAFGS